MPPEPESSVVPESPEGHPSAKAAEVMLAEARRLYEDNLEHFRDLEKKATWLAGGVGAAIVAAVGIYPGSRAARLLPPGVHDWQRGLVCIVFALMCVCVGGALLLLVWSLQVSRTEVPDPYRLVRRSYASYPAVVVTTISALEYAKVAKSGLRMLRRKASFYGLATIALVLGVALLAAFGIATAWPWAR